LICGTRYPITEVLAWTMGWHGGYHIMCCCYLRWK